jgi:hypothetical protein
MGFLNQTRFIERMRFFEGQRLFAADLQGLEAFNREMRWLHNHSLHQPGIGSGFAVYASKGDRQVQIGAGYAIDDQGREIILTREQVEQVPPISGEAGVPAYFDLTVSYPDDSSLVETEFREGLCETRGAVRLQEAPVFCWVRLVKDGRGQFSPKEGESVALEIQTGRKITLARVEVLNCQVQRLLLTESRRDARPDCTPYIACGVKDPPAWVEDTPEKLKKEALLLRTTISTLDAGFETVPAYSVSISGPRMAEFSVPGDIEAGDLTIRLLLLDELRILESRRDALDVLLLVFMAQLPGEGDFGEGEIVGTDENKGRELIVEWIQQHWPVEWMGVEG